MLIFNSCRKTILHYVNLGCHLHSLWPTSALINYTHAVSDKSNLTLNMNRTQCFTTFLSNSMNNVPHNHHVLSSSIMFMFKSFLTHSSVFVKHKCKKFTYHSTFKNCSKTFGHPYCHVTNHKDLGISSWKSRLWKGILLYPWHVFFYEIILKFTKHCVTWTMHCTEVIFTLTRGEQADLLHIKQDTRSC